tara:strand:- start:5170 stop:5409 length:240 start_codon:yes stop_codon:yes gene_type:complete
MSKLKEYFNNVDNIDNLLDLIVEWEEVVGAKELEDNETGFNSERIKKLWVLLCTHKEALIHKGYKSLQIQKENKYMEDQ